MRAIRMVAQSPRLIERIVNKAPQLIAFWPFHCSQTVMDKASDEAAVNQAIERIEAALSRLESAAARTRDLHERHGKLRGSVEAALGDIDALIARRRS